MVFNSFAFLIFFPIVLLLYFVLPHRFRWAMLLAASYYFYISWNTDLIFLILFTTLVSYASSILIENHRKKHPGSEHDFYSRFWLVLALVVSFGVLFFFKYFNFLSESVTAVIALFTMKPSEPLILDLILPVGISFYTFQTLSYVIDVYKGTVKAERHFGYYALYVSFFAQLVAGPIERPENLIPQIHAYNKPKWENTVLGLRKMLIGFFKKVVVADLLATYVTAVYNNVQNANGFGVLIATVLFAFQIYCDFAGYTDIAIGCAKIMGIDLMQNFNRPYISESIQEFWRRWHISLSSWFKDYLYFPLGGSRCSKPRHMMNIMIVFIVSGLWHGAAWTFVIWGFLHGFYQVVGAFTLKARNGMWQKLGIDPKTSIGVRFVRRAVTFMLVCFAWIFFRANSFSGLITLVTKLFTDWQFSISYFTNTFDSMGFTAAGILTTILSLLILRRLDITGLKAMPDDGGVTPRTSVARYVLTAWAIVFAWLLLLAGDGASSFIYFQF